MATRRESLAAVLGSDNDSINGNGTEANGPGNEAEAGFPFELLSGSGSRIEDEAFPTRVRSEKKSDKSSDKTDRTKTERPRGTATERQLAEIGEQLEEKAIAFALLAQGLAPVTSVYAAENSPKAVTALLSIAKRRPGVLKYLAKAADTVDFVEIAKFVGGLVICIQVDAQRLRGDELPAQAFGVTQILEEFFWTEQNKPANPAVQFQAPRYAPV